ncbi:hypothetical protein D4764_04G0011540 [Takifugu flavidus]|uniref:Alkylated DNA repair protein AlkB homologue 8 N-terminal domain-containing protein n=1 Tax=Takifugu flavidus TaxID=433684 RepID=A0A5C6NA42_9TELE|nr:hypothetical protein D4764_04G0011540 [Takifugu flavidus]
MLFKPAPINAGKTKELVVDFRRRNNPPPAPVNILGTDVDVVESYKRLRSFGVQGPLLRTFYDSVVGSAIFYRIVCWSSSITDRDRKRMDRLVRRASSVLGCPLDRDRRRMDRLVRRASSVLGCPLDRDRERMDRLVRRASSVLGCPLDRDRKRMDRLVRRASSVLGCPLDRDRRRMDRLVRRASSVLGCPLDRDRRRMDRLVRRASSVLGCPLDSVEVMGNGRMMAKLSSMLNNTSHPLQDTLAALGSSFRERLLHPRCVKERYRRSFLPAAVRLHNKHNNR